MVSSGTPLENRRRPHTFEVDIYPRPWFTPPSMQDECDHKKMTRSWQTRDDKMKTYVHIVEEEFRHIVFRHQPTVDDPMGHAEVLRELEDTLI